jgi:hypothetical protein
MFGNDLMGMLLKKVLKDKVSPRQLTNALVLFAPNPLSLLVEEEIKNTLREKAVGNVDFHRKVEGALNSAKGVTVAGENASRRKTLFGAEDEDEDRKRKKIIDAYLLIRPEIINRRKLFFLDLF